MWAAVANVMLGTWIGSVTLIEGRHPNLALLGLLIMVVASMAMLWPRTRRLNVVLGLATVLVGLRAEPFTFPVFTAVCAGALVAVLSLRRVRPEWAAPEYTEFTV